MKYALLAALMCAASVPAMAEQPRALHSISEQEMGDICQQAWGAESMMQHQPVTRDMPLDQLDSYVNVLLMNAMGDHNVSIHDLDTMKMLCRFYLRGSGDLAEAVIAKLDAPELAQLEPYLLAPQSR